MSTLSGPVIIGQDLYTESSTPLNAIGALGYDKYGTRYRYVKNGGTALTTGNLLQEPAEDTAFRSMVVNTASAIGSSDIEVTLGGTATTADLFKDGLLVVESSTGIGQLRRIVTHDVQSTTTGTCTFTVDVPLKIALVASSSQVSVRKNPYRGVIQWPTTPTGSPVGVALYAMSANYYGWIVSGGPCAVLFDNTDNSAADAEGICPSTTVAGSVKAMLAADVADRVLGWSMEEVSVDSTMGFVYLTID